MLEITPEIRIRLSEIKLTFIRAPGPGGQNVNKVATGVQLRFNIARSSLPKDLQERLFVQLGTKVTLEGDILIKATRYRTQILNKQDALERLQGLIQKATKVPKKRKKTKPTLAAKQSRLEKKKKQSKTKSLRSKRFNHD